VADLKNKDFCITILGSGSATPALNRFHSAQIVLFKGQRLLLDSGEGTQYKLLLYDSLSPVHKILITHVHGDHILGLPGLFFTFSLNGVERPVHLYSTSQAIEWFSTFKDWLTIPLSFPVHTHVAPLDKKNLLYSDKEMDIFSIPLKHTSAAVGYIIKENLPPRKINPEALKKFNIPYNQLNSVKMGYDATSREGETIPNAQITLPNRTPRSYAFITDTLYVPELADYLKEVTVLYHEATFSEEHSEEANLTGHSTAIQAAQLAKQAQVKLLLIGHISSRYTKPEELVMEARKVFPNTFLAMEGLKVWLEIDKIWLQYPDGSEFSL